MATKIKNQKGFATILLMSLLPVLLTLICFSWFFLSIRQVKSESAHICRATLLNGQKKAAAPLRILLALNKKAVSLEIQLQKANLRLKLAIASQNAVAFAAATAAILRIKAQQKSLSYQQKSLISWANKELLQTSLEAKIKVQQKLSKQSYLLKNLLSLLNIQVKSFSTKLAVEAINPMSLAPSYRPKSDFERQQSLRVHWKYKLQTNQNKWASAFLKIDKNFKDSCVASLKARGNGWIAILKEDRLL